jgi:hypothetical protein
VLIPVDIFSCDRLVRMFWFLLILQAFLEVVERGERARRGDPSTLEVSPAGRTLISIPTG